MLRQEPASRRSAASPAAPCASQASGEPSATNCAARDRRESFRRSAHTLSTHVRKRRLEQCRVSFGHGHAEVDDPCVRPAARHVHAVRPALHDVGVGTAVRIRTAQPASRAMGAVNVELRPPSLRRETRRWRSRRVSARTVRVIDAGGEVGMNEADRLAHQASGSLRGSPERDQRHPNRRAVVDPGSSLHASKMRVVVTIAVQAPRDSRHRESSSSPPAPPAAARPASICARALSNQ